MNFHLNENGNNYLDICLNLSDKNLNDSDLDKILNIKSNSNISYVDLNNNNITYIPEKLIEIYPNIKKLDILNNPILDFNGLKKFKNLLDLNININDPKEVISLLNNSIKLCKLNNIYTTNSIFIDLEEKILEEHSFKNEFQSYNKILIKFKKLFKCKNIIDNYSLKDGEDKDITNISQNDLFDNFLIKFQELVEKETLSLNSLIEKEKENFSLFSKVNTTKLKIYSHFLNSLTTLIFEENKIDLILFDNNIINSENQNKLKLLIQEYKETIHNINKDCLDHIQILINSYDIVFKELSNKIEENNLFFSKIEELDMEKNKIIKNSRLVIKNLEETISKFKLNNTNFNSIVNGNREKEKVISGESYNSVDIHKNYNSRNLINQHNCLSPEKLHVKKTFTINFMKDLIEEIYESKTKHDMKCLDLKQNRETLDQYIFSFLTQRHGLKELVMENLITLYNSIKKYAKNSVEISFFGKILRNDIEEDYRYIFIKLKSTIKELLVLAIKNKYPLKLSSEITELIKSKENQTLLLEKDEWSYIIKFLYETKDSKLVELLIKKDSISFIQLEKIILNYQVTSRINYLKQFTRIFKNFDSEKKGFLNDKEFDELIIYLKELKSINGYTNKLNSEDIIKNHFCSKNRLNYSDIISSFSKIKINFGNVLITLMDLISKKISNE